jgi:hypothetical protein
MVSYTERYASSSVMVTIKIKRISKKVNKIWEIEEGQRQKREGNRMLAVQQQ